MAGFAHRLEHRPAGVHVAAPGGPHRVAAGAPPADIQPRFGQLIGGPVDAEGGFGDAGCTAKGMTHQIESLSGG